MQMLFKEQGAAYINHLTIEKRLLLTEINLFFFSRTIMFQLIKMSITFRFNRFELEKAPFSGF